MPTLLTALLLAPLNVLHAATALQPPDKPNILLILADDRGYGDPGCYNPRSKIATPQIDRLAREGMRFTDAHAPGPLCHPSRYGLMTGRYPFRTDITRWPKQPLIEEGQMTIASLLKSQGYRTAMVGKWHLGFREDDYDHPLPGGPVACGFDTYFGLRASTDIPPYFFIRGDRAVTPPTDHIEEHHSTGWSPISPRWTRADWPRTRWSFSPPTTVPSGMAPSVWRNCFHSVASSRTNCCVVGSRRLLTPRPSSRRGRRTSLSRPSRKHPSR